MPVGASWTREQLDALDGLSVHDDVAAGSSACACSTSCPSPARWTPPPTRFMTEVRARLKFLCDGPGLPDAGPPEPHAVRRRGAAHQSGPRCWAHRWRTRCSCWTSRPSACTRATCTASVEAQPAAQRRQHAGGRRARPASWWPPTASSTSAPGLGERGGRIVHSPRCAPRHPDRRLSRQPPARRGATLPMPVAANTPRLILKASARTTLKNVSVELPLGRLCVTGVSGSGKSHAGAGRAHPAPAAEGQADRGPRRLPAPAGRRADRRRGHGGPDPIGKTARSNPASAPSTRSKRCCARARGHTRRHLQLQRWRRRDLRRHRLRARGDAVPVGCYLRCPDCDGSASAPRCWRASTWSWWTRPPSEDGQSGAMSGLRDAAVRRRHVGERGHRHAVRRRGRAGGRPPGERRGHLHRQGRPEAVPSSTWARARPSTKCWK